MFSSGTELPASAGSVSYICESFQMVSAEDKDSLSSRQGQVSREGLKLESGKHVAGFLMARIPLH